MISQESRQRAVTSNLRNSHPQFVFLINQLNHTVRRQHNVDSTLTKKIAENGKKTLKLEDH